MLSATVAAMLAAFHVLASAATSVAFHVLASAATSVARGKRAAL